MKIGLALTTLFFAVLMPPEAYPVGGTIVALSSTFSFLIALAERRVPEKYLLGGFVGFLVLLAHSLLFSVDIYRSFSFIVALWAYYCLVGFFMTADLIVHRWFAFVIVGLCLVVSSYGLYQHFWGIGAVSQEIVASGASEAMKRGMLDRLQTGRIFSTFALPGTLWGFLLASIPIHAALWRQNRALNALLSLSLVMALTAGILTHSFGFLLGLFAAATAWCMVRYGRIEFKKILAVLLTLVVAGAFFIAARQETLTEGNPIVLRFKNWVSAWNIFAVHPLGTGLNTFGIIYPQYKLPAANDTQFAHNTPLQLMSEIGWIAILTAMAGVVLVVRRKPDVRADLGRSTALVALIAWFVHNLLDINVYFPCIGTMGAILNGLTFSGGKRPPFTPSRMLTAGIWTVAMSCLIFSGLAVVAGELEHRARIEYETGKPLEAVKTLDLAIGVSPFNSDLRQASGEILLDQFQKTQNRSYLEQATQNYKKATELSPMKFDTHVGLALCLSAGNEIDSAIEEINVACNLFPSNTYVRAIARLIEQRAR